jgi:tetratricopeptide (TPR) repeat protein
MNAFFLKDRSKNQLIAEKLYPAREWLKAAALMAVTALFYLPAWHGSFLWDDNTHISDNAVLRVAGGLREIWTNPDATCQYYPLTFSVFWAGYHLWGLNTAGYHILNIFLHGFAAVLLWQLLSRLRVKGALLAGAVFALHPVNVMSVAWMTELKNTMSGSLALGACMAYVRFAGLTTYPSSSDSILKYNTPKLHWGYYALSLVLFQLAMFSKTAVSFLPATLLLIVWWKWERLRLRDLFPLLPMFGISIGMGALTIYIEHHSGLASGKEFSLGLLDRVLVSGRSFWFYAGKLVFPYKLTFIYERWNIDARIWWQYLYPAATLGLLSGLWLLRRRIGKGAFVAVMHYYISTSMLILAVVLYMMRYSFVSDHWQYFGSMSLIGLMAAIVTGLWERLGKRLVACGKLLSLGLLLLLGILTWKQCEMYADNETLWKTTVERNQNSWMPHDNYGVALLQNGKVDEAIAEHYKALKLNPNSAEICNNLANALLQNNQIQEAVANYEKSISINPSNPSTYFNLGNLLLYHTTQLDYAILHLEKCLEMERAAGVWQENVYAHYDLGIAFYKRGRIEESVSHYQKALEIQPGFAEARNNLVWILSTSPVDAIRNGAKALDLALESDRLANGRDPAVLRNLAAAYAEVGRFPEAVETAQRAYSISILQTDASLAESLLGDMKLYQAGKPLRDISPH